MKYLEFEQIPDELEVWSPLLSVLRPLRLSVSVFNDLIRFAALPPELTSSITFFENLSVILKKLSVILKTDKHYDELARKVVNWERYCELIVGDRKSIQTSLPNMFSPGKDSLTPPFFGYYETHPLGVALWCSPIDPLLQERYSFLQAYLCLATYMLRSLEVRNPHRYMDAKIRACRAARQLAHPDNKNLLIKLPEVAVSLEDYRRAFAKKVIGEKFHPIIVLFDDALETKQGRGKGARKRKLANKFNLQRQTIEFGDEDNPHDREQVSVLTASTVPVSKLQAAKKLLCSSAEIDSKEYIICEESGSDPSGGRSISQQYIKAKGAASAIAMHNQRLATGWNQLTNHEIAVFLRELKELARRDDDFSGVPARELAAFLAIVFWTSASTKVAVKATRVSDVANCKGALGIQRESDQLAFWVVKPYVPRLRLVPKKVLEKQALPFAVRFSLPIPCEAMEIIARHLNRMKASYKAIRIFKGKGKEKELESAAGDFFRRIRKREGGRQNLQRISGCLYYQLLSMQGSDVTAAMSICGKNDPLGIVPLHYTANGINWLIGIYSLASQTLVGRSVSASLSSKREGEKDSSGKYNYFVGSRFVPKDETVTAMVNDLRERIKIARKKYIDEGNPTQLHNDLTVYTVMMLGFATGFRAVRDPLLQAAEIDRTTGFGLISDKDGDDYYNARIIWLPQLCMQQLDNYRNHVKSLQHWVFDRNQDLFFKIRHQDVTGRYTSREYPALFLLLKNGKDLSVHPKVLQDLLSTIDYHLPMNANRHYLRTNLISDKCPVEVVDAFMGHWERGQEPWGRYSGLSPIVYREKLKEHLVPLLGRNEWKPEEGLQYGG